MEKNKIIVRSPKDKSEVDKGFVLAKKTFKNIKHHNLIDKFYASDKLKNINLVINLNNNEVIGFSINIIKFIYLFKTKIKCGFISSICIEKKYRGKGFSKLLIEESNNNLKKNNVLLSIVIARKKLDYFYNKFNFWGVSYFPKIIIKKKFDLDINTNRYFLKPVKLSDINSINKLYRNTYSKINNFIPRNLNNWSFIIEKCKNEKINFFKYCSANNIDGYVVFKNNDIYEISSRKNSFYIKFIDYLMYKTYSETLIIHTNFNHQIYKSFYNYKTEYFYRNVPQGGHMIKILNTSSFLKKFKDFKTKNNIKNLTIDFFRLKNIRISLKTNDNKKHFYFNYLDQI